jgi:hypothetical protein
MITQHLKDEDIQQYALDQSNCEAKVSSHMEACGDCRAIAAQYRQLFTAIGEQPKPAFDFDVSGIALPLRVKPRSAFSITNFVIGFLSLAGLLAFGMAIYLSPGIAGWITYSLVAAAILIVLFQGIGLYKKYQQKINVLKLY